MAVMRLKRLKLILTAIAAILFCGDAFSQAPFEKIETEESVTVTKVL